MMRIPRLALPRARDVFLLMKGAGLGGLMAHRRGRN